MATQKRTVEVQLATTGVGAGGRTQRTPLVTDESGNVTTLEAPRGTLQDEPGPRRSGRSK